MTHDDAVLEPELAIIGAGPAGLTAGVFAVDKGIDTVILEGGRAGGQLATLYPHKPVYNYPGNSGIPAGSLAKRMVRQAVESGVAPSEECEVSGLRIVENGISVETDRARYLVSAVILACGMGLVLPRRLEVDGEREVEGKKLFYVIDDPDGWNETKVVVVGGGDGAADNALLLARHAAEVTIIHRREALRAQERTVEALRSAGVRMLLGWDVGHIVDSTDGISLHVKRADGGEERRIDCLRVLVNIGVRANTDFLRTLPLERVKARVAVDTEMRTSADGVFACGDLVAYPGKSRLIVTAVGEAATAVNSVERYLRKRRH